VVEYFVSRGLQKNTVVFSQIKEMAKGGVSIIFAIGKKRP
jgi:hypothetical protein